MSSLIKCLTLCLLGIAASGSAEASLGQKMASVDADRARFSAKMSSVRLVNYDRHELTLDSGTVTREYVSGGVVFAVSWQGPVRPDLKQIFADYYPRFQADNVPAGRIPYASGLGLNSRRLCRTHGGPQRGVLGLCLFASGLTA